MANADECGVAEDGGVVGGKILLRFQHKLAFLCHLIDDLG
jgi:hypothetical protein